MRSMLGAFRASITAWEPPPMADHAKAVPRIPSDSGAANGNATRFTGSTAPAATAPVNWPTVPPHVRSRLNGLVAELRQVQIGPAVAVLGDPLVEGAFVEHDLLAVGLLHVEVCQ